MPGRSGRTIDLPVRGGLGTTYALAVLVSILTAACSVAALAAASSVYPTEEVRRAFLPNDVANLCVGLPLLLVSLLLSWRGSWAGLLSLPGALLFVTYNSLAYAFALAFRPAFPVYVVEVLLSGAASIALVVHIDGAAVRQRLMGAVPARFSGAVLGGLGFLFFARGVEEVLRALAGLRLLSRPEFAVDLTDVLVAPAWMAAGILLFRKRALGYVTGFVLLAQASLLFLGLAAFVLAAPHWTGGPRRAADVAVVLGMGMICFIPLGLFVRAAELRSRR